MALADIHGSAIVMPTECALPTAKTDTKTTE